MAFGTGSGVTPGGTQVETPARTRPVIVVARRPGRRPAACRAPCSAWPQTPGLPPPPQTSAPAAGPALREVPASVARGPAIVAEASRRSPRGRAAGPLLAMPPQRLKPPPPQKAGAVHAAAIEDAAAAVARGPARGTERRQVPGCSRRPSRRRRERRPARPHWLKPPPPQNSGAAQAPQSTTPPQPSALRPHVEPELRAALRARRCRRRPVAPRRQSRSD